MSHSFTEVFSHHAAYVLGLVRRLGVQEREVEDVAQEVFVIVHRQLPGFDGRSTLKTWICGIALNVAANHRRKAYRRREQPEDFAAQQETLLRHEPTQEHELDRLREAEALQRALGALSEKLRDVFVLYEIEELSMSEVARVLGIRRFTAYSRLREARIKIAAALTQEASALGTVLTKAHGGAT